MEQQFTERWLRQLRVHDIRNGHCDVTGSILRFIFSKIYWMNPLIESKAFYNSRSNNLFLLLVITLRVRNEIQTNIFERI